VETDPVAAQLFEYLRNALYFPNEAKLDPEDLPERFRDFAKGLVYYVQSVREAGILASDIAQGNLDSNPLSPGNEVASGLKSLQASLRHLTWQAQQIAKGDYKQRVSFMGEFSEAMNNMIEQLDERRVALEEEIEAGAKKSQALQQGLAVFEDITAQMSQLIIVLDRSTQEQLLCNRPVKQVLTDPENVSHLYGWLYNQLNSSRSGAKATHELELMCEEGFQSFLVEQHSYMWGDHDAVVFVLTDTTMNRRELSSLEEIANFDPLTGLYSRHFGMATFNRWLDQQLDFALCFIDMDNLKYVNDEFGHNEGDRYILLVAEQLRAFADDAVISRLGGDEFMLLARGWSENAAEARLEQLREVLRSRIPEADEAVYNHSMSFGVVGVGSDNETLATDLLSAADEKMYLYKRAHKAERMPD
jgi:diguanylate cyclase (GGDEF)-like protein